MVTTMSVSLWLASVSLALPNGINNVIKPCGQKLCKERCESLSYCSSPVYDFNTLTCVLRNKSDSKTNELDLYRRITARDERKIQVPVGLKKSEEKLEKSRTSRNPTNDISNALMVKETYKIKSGDCFRYNFKRDLIIPGLCADPPPLFYYQRGVKMIYGTFKSANVKGLWVITNEVRCPKLRRRDIVGRATYWQEHYADVPQFAQRSEKDFVIWIYTGLKANKGCRDSIKVVKHHHFEW